MCDPFLPLGSVEVCVPGVLQASGLCSFPGGALAAPALLGNHVLHFGEFFLNYLDFPPF